MSLFSSFQPLSEAERFAYLKAMGVTLWVPRDDAELLELEASGTSQHSAQTIAQNEADPVEVRADETATVQAKQAESVSDLTDKILPGNSQSKLETNTAPQNAPTENKIEVKRSSKAASAGFLKMVNWSNGNEHAPLLMIVCRHDPDQPAQSFARPNMPSQFMVDYVRAIQEYLSSAKLDFKIQLAHLTEAGLGDNNLPIESVLDKQSPKLLLVLGDEGATHLFGEEQTVAVNRGKQLSVLEQVNALVSYHPFTLISQPELKRNALEDLRSLVQLLKLSAPQSE